MDYLFLGSLGCNKSLIEFLVLVLPPSTPSSFRPPDGLFKKFDQVSLKLAHQQSTFPPLVSPTPWTWFPEAACAQLYFLSVDSCRCHWLIYLLPFPSSTLPPWTSDQLSNPDSQVHIFSCSRTELSLSTGTLLASVQEDLVLSKHHPLRRGGMEAEHKHRVWWNQTSEGIRAFLLSTPPPIHHIVLKWYVHVGLLLDWEFFKAKMVFLLWTVGT